MNTDHKVEKAHADELTRLKNELKKYRKKEKAWKEKELELQNLIAQRDGELAFMCQVFNNLKEKLKKNDAGAVPVFHGTVREERKKGAALRSSTK